MAGCQRSFSHLFLSIVSKVQSRSTSSCAVLLHVSDWDGRFSCHVPTHIKQQRRIANIGAQAKGGPRCNMQSCAKAEQPIGRKEAICELRSRPRGRTTSCRAEPGSAQFHRCSTVLSLGTQLRGTPGQDSRCEAKDFVPSCSPARGCFGCSERA